MAKVAFISIEDEEKNVVYLAMINKDDIPRYIEHLEDYIAEHMELVDRHTGETFFRRTKNER